MSNMTNAQAALLAAATIYTGSASNISVNTLQGMASQLKRGLDRADQQDKDAKEAARAAEPTRTRLLGFTPAHPCGPTPREPTFTDIVENLPTAPPRP